MLSPEESKDKHDLDDLIRDGVPIDDEHPNFAQNLSPNEQDKFDELAAKPAEQVEPEDRKALDELKNKIVHGDPLNSAHPSAANLSPE